MSPVTASVQEISEQKLAGGEGAPAFQHRKVPSKPLYTTACLLGSDMLALVLAVALSLAAKSIFHHDLLLSSYLRLWPFLFVFALVYAVVGLYSEVALSPPEELRRAVLSSSLVFMGLATVTVSLRGATRFVTLTLFMSVVLSVVLVPLQRAVVRQLCARHDWWGYPAVVFGAGAAGNALVHALRREPELGLKPIAVVDPNTSYQHLHHVPVVPGEQLAAELVEANRFVYGIVATSGPSGQQAINDFERFGFQFSHIIYISDMVDFSTLWVKPRSVGGMLGLEVCNSFLLKETQVAKRIIDLVLTTAVGILVLPAVALIALAAKLESKGPIFYSQRRVGMGGKLFYAWKFRTMVENADAVFEHHLNSDPALRFEWELNHKLKNDPRVTRVGKFLRKTSLDELPQIWNVLKGEMSLVGPRPIVQAEVAKYGAGYELYIKVKSGVTGLWQVSGRNDTSYDDRVKLDCLYVRNWSVWLDLCILFRTIGTVLLRKGAY